MIAGRPETNRRLHAPDGSQTCRGRQITASGSRIEFQKRHTGVDSQGWDDEVAYGIGKCGLRGKVVFRVDLAALIVLDCPGSFLLMWFFDYRKRQQTPKLSGWERTRKGNRCSKCSETNKHIKRKESKTSSINCGMIWTNRGKKSMRPSRSSRMMICSS